MALSLRSNVAAQQAVRRLSDSQCLVASSYQRLSSGLRISRASDDAAGLSISESLKAESRIAVQGVRNVNDGIGYLAVADGAAEALTEILQRGQELATQAATGTLTTSQRQPLNQELVALASEYNRILEFTSFNGRAVFGAGTGPLVVQAGGETRTITIGTEASITAGNGTFTAGATFTTDGGIPTDPVVGDFDGDGWLDLVAGSQNGLFFFGNNHAGSFSPRLTISAADFGGAQVRGGDFNGDGRHDFVVGDGSLLQAFYGNGNGTFSIGTSSPGIGTPNLETGDLNGDGFTDVVFTGEAPAEVRVHFGTSGTTFTGITTFSSGGGYPQGTVLNDVNGDGRLDLLVSKYTSGEIETRLGNANGTFGGVLTSTLDTGSNHLVAGDFNGDGRVDVAQRDGSGNIRIGFGAGNGTFAAGPLFSAGVPGGPGAHGTSARDMNGDGVLDLVLAGPSFQVALGNGDGTFRVTSTLAGGVGNALGDWNRDGALDYITSGLTGQLFLGNPATTTVSNRLRPVSGLSVSTQADARTTLDSLRSTHDLVTAVRARIGAGQSRLGAVAGVLQTRRVELDASAARITDVDLAEETSRLVRNKILLQAGTAILAQANLQPQVVISLLSRNR